MIGKCAACGQDAELKQLPIKFPFKYCVTCYDKAFAMFGPRAKQLARQRGQKISMGTAIADAQKIMLETAEKENKFKSDSQ